jgi:hypothetical protein
MLPPLAAAAAAAAARSQHINKFSQWSPPLPHSFGIMLSADQSASPGPFRLDIESVSTK